MEQNEVTSAESRRDVLKKIGMALAAAPLAALPQKEAIAQPRLRAAQLDAKVKTLAASAEGKEVAVFFGKTKRGPASVVVVDANDRASVDGAIKSLGGAKPGRGKVAGGVVVVDLGVAAEGRCTISGAGAVASFDPIGPGDPFKAPIVRAR